MWSLFQCIFIVFLVAEGYNMQYFDITFMILRDIYAFLPFLFMTHVAHTSIYSTFFSFRRYI